MIDFSGGFLAFSYRWFAHSAHPIVVRANITVGRFPAKWVNRWPPFRSFFSGLRMYSRTRLSSLTCFRVRFVLILISWLFWSIEFRKWALCWLLLIYTKLLWSQWSYDFIHRIWWHWQFSSFLKIILIYFRVYFSCNEYCADWKHQFNFLVTVISITS